MRLLSSTLIRADLTPARWNGLADLLRANKGSMGDLGGGNHFLDALEPIDGGSIWFLIHTGSRQESGLVDDLVDQPALFDEEFARIVGWAESNREAVQHAIEAIFGPTELILDLPHNTCEVQTDGAVLIRKGSVRLLPGQQTVLPSHMAGDVVLLRATDQIQTTLSSMSHGTGRKLPRGESKIPAAEFDFEALRKRILFPEGLADASLRTEGPYAYRDLDDCLALISDLVVVESRFIVVAYMGHL
jgi:RNA-splicing ligase RtcB